MQGGKRGQYGEPGDAENDAERVTQARGNFLALCIVRMGLGLAHDGIARGQGLLMMKLPNATPTSQPLLLPESASEMGPLVTTRALADLFAPACASAVA